MDKKVLMNVESVYTAFAFRSGGRDYVAAGSETCPAATDNPRSRTSRSTSPSWIMPTAQSTPA